MIPCPVPLLVLPLFLVCVKAEAGITHPSTKRNGTNYRDNHRKQNNTQEENKMSPNNIVVSALLLLLICCWSTVLSVLTADFPLPFKRQLAVGSEGNDVHILQELLKRSPTVPKSLHMKDKVFDADTAHALELFQTSVHLSKTGKMDIATADAVLRHLMADQYKPK